MHMGSRVGVRAVVKALVSASASVLVGVGVGVGAGGAAYGQCEQWLAGPPLAGINGQVNAITAWDPDGPGPEHARLVAVGDFTVAGSAVVQNIAVLDPQTQRWSGFAPSGIFSALSHVIGAPDGRLYVGSPVVTNAVGGVSITLGLGVFESNRWQRAQLLSVFPVRSSPWVTSLALASNGDVLSISSHNAPFGSRVRGTSVVPSLDFLPEAWSSESASSDVSTPGWYFLLPVRDGSLLVAGDFSRASGSGASRVFMNNVMRLTTAGPQKLEKELNAGVTAAATLNDGRTILAGRFTSSGEVDGLNGLAIYDGATFEPVVGNAFEGGTDISSIAQHPSGDLYFAGSLVIKGKRHLAARISNGVLIPIGPTFLPWEIGLTVHHVPAPGRRPPAFSVAILPSGQVYFGGRYAPAGLPLINVARIINDTFEPASPGVVGRVNTIAPMPDGRLLVAGAFRTTSDSRIANIAAWDGLDLRYIAPDIEGPIGPAAALADGRILALRQPVNPMVGSRSESFVLDSGGWRLLPNASFLGHVTPSGEALAAVDTRSADGTPARALSRLIGDSFVPQSPPLGLTGLVTMLPDGNVLYARPIQPTGSSRIEFADTDRWKQVGGTLTNSVWGLTQLPDGRFVALLGSSSQTDTILRVFDGRDWVPLLPGSGPGVPSRRMLHLNAAARTDAELDFLVFGSAAPRRYRGAAGTWAGLSGGLGAYNGLGIVGGVGPVNALVRLPSGEILAGGEIVVAGTRPAPTGTIVSALLARYTLTGIPTIARQPTAAAPIISAGQTIEVTFTPSPGYSVQNVRWSRDGVPIFNGPGGASPDGGTVIGGATDIITPTDGSPVSLLITGAQPSDSGRYAVTLVSACGQATSQDVAVRVNPAACSPADIATTDGQTGFADGGPDGAIDNGDFVAFFAAFFAGDGDPSRAAADIANADGATTLDGGGPDGAVTSTDFAAFFALFFEGCGG
jgi:hypothetical protein